MKKLIVLILTISAFYSCNKQVSFEGRIKYKISQEVYCDTLPLEFIKNNSGDSCDVIYNNGNIEWKVYNSTFWSGSIYNNKKNELYYFIPESKDILFVDCDEVDVESESFELLKNQDTILDYPCDLLIIKSKYSEKSWTGQERIRYFYFTKDLPLDPNLYSDYNYNSQNLIIQKTGGIALRIIDSFKDFSITYEAVEIDSNFNKKINTKIDRKQLVEM